MEGAVWEAPNNNKYSNNARGGVVPAASYLKFVKGGYKPAGRSPAQRSAARAFLLAANGETTNTIVGHEPVLPREYFLSNQTSVGGFHYAVDPELVELLSLIDGRCGFELRDSEKLTPRQLEQSVFLKTATLFKRSRDGLGAWPFNVACAAVVAHPQPARAVDGIDRLLSSAFSVC